MMNGQSQGKHRYFLVQIFVPWENVIMCGETEFAGPLVERFAGYHRVSYGGCKVGVGDVLIGAAALAAGIQRHRKNLPYQRETDRNDPSERDPVFLRYSRFGGRVPRLRLRQLSMVDLLIGNVCKLNVTRFPYETGAAGGGHRRGADGDAAL